MAAISSRRRGGAADYTWPGYVDALTTLLMVLIFLLTLFSVEKAAYELCYEAANRPDWIEVPLRGLLSLTENLLKP